MVTQERSSVVVFIPKMGREITIQHIRAVFDRKGLGLVNSVRIADKPNGRGWKMAWVRFDVRPTAKSHLVLNRLCNGEGHKLYYSEDVDWWYWKLLCPRDAAHKADLCNMARVSREEQWDVPGALVATKGHYYRAEKSGAVAEGAKRMEARIFSEQSRADLEEACIRDMEAYLVKLIS